MSDNSLKVFYEWDFKRTLHNKKPKLVITHLWVDGFGWENTILIEEDFINIKKLNNDLKNLILIAKDIDDSVKILKGYHS